MITHSIVKSTWSLTSYWSFCQSVIYSYAAFVSCALMFTPIALWTVLKLKRYISLTNRHSTHKGAYTNQITSTLYMSILMYCWMGFLGLYGLHFHILYQFEHYQSTRLDALPELYLPCSAPGHYMLYMLGGLFLTELPILAYYFYEHGNISLRAGTKKFTRQCYIVMRSARWIGLVYYQQTLAGYLVYYLMLLIVSPVYAIANCAQFITISAFMVALTSLAIHPCVHRGKMQCKGYCYLIFATLASIHLIGISCLLVIISSDNEQTSFDSTKIISATFTTLLLSCLAYFVRKVLFQTKLKSNENEEMGYSFGDRRSELEDELMIEIK